MPFCHVPPVRGGRWPCRGAFLVPPVRGWKWVGRGVCVCSARARRAWGALWRSWLFRPCAAVFEPNHAPYDSLRRLYWLCVPVEHSECARHVADGMDDDCRGDASTGVTQPSRKETESERQEYRQRPETRCHY